MANKKETFLVGVTITGTVTTTSRKKAKEVMQKYRDRIRWNYPESEYEEGLGDFHGMNVLVVVHETIATVWNKDTKSFEVVDIE